MCTCNLSLSLSFFLLLLRTLCGVDYCVSRIGVGCVCAHALGVLRARLRAGDLMGTLFLNTLVSSDLSVKESRIIRALSRV